MEPTTFRISKAIILHRRYGTDLVFLKTDLPSTAPAVDAETLDLHFDCAKGSALDYVTRHFPHLAVEIIEEAREKATAVLRVEDRG